MPDYNLLNRASFDDAQKTVKVTVPPFMVEGGGVLDLGGSLNVFWVKHITWRYKYIDVGIPNARQRPIEDIRVTVADIDVLQDVERPVPAFTEPKPIVSKIFFKVKNTNVHNNHQLSVDFYITGVLVTPRQNAEPLTLKQMKAYIMLDSSERGKLAMEEAAMDQLEEHLSKVGMGSLREILPGGLGTLAALPAPLQQAMLSGLAAKGGAPLMLGMQTQQAPPMQALPLAEPEREQSTFIGDIVSGWPEDLPVPARSQL